MPDGTRTLSSIQRDKGSRRLRIILTILKNLPRMVRVRGQHHPYRPPFETGAIASWLAADHSELFEI